MSQGAAAVPGTAALVSTPAAIQDSTKSAGDTTDAVMQGVCQRPLNGADTTVAPNQEASRPPADGAADGNHLAAIRTIAQLAAGPGAAVPNGRVQSGGAAAGRASETAGILRRSSSSKHEPIRFSPPISSPRKSAWERIDSPTKVQPAPVWKRLGRHVQARIMPVCMGSISCPRLHSLFPSTSIMPAAVRGATHSWGMIRKLQAALQGPFARGRSSQMCNCCAVSLLHIITDVKGPCNSHSRSVWTAVSERAGLSCRHRQPRLTGAHLRPPHRNILHRHRRPLPRSGAPV